MTIKDPDEDTKCGICKQAKVRLPNATEKHGLPVYVCNKGRPNSKAPCDGYAWDIAIKNG